MRRDIRNIGVEFHTSGNYQNSLHVYKVDFIKHVLCASQYLQDLSNIIQYDLMKH